MRKNNRKPIFLVCLLGQWMDSVLGSSQPDETDEARLPMIDNRLHDDRSGGFCKNPKCRTATKDLLLNRMYECCHKMNGSNKPKPTFLAVFGRHYKLSSGQQLHNFEMLCTASGKKNVIFPDI